MNNADSLPKIRHSLAHLLARAVLDFYPDAKNTIGPAIDNGFYYDFEFSTPIADADLKKIEKKMREILKSWKDFSHKEVTAEEAKKHFAGNPYKLELIDEIVERNKKGGTVNGGQEKITLYTAGAGTKGEFTDLCRGGHVKSPSAEIKPDTFKITHLAGAYWRGDEKNKMLTRIYGLAFETKEALNQYETQLEEAKKRDHKKLGRELGLYMFHETAPGMPYWLPKGLALYNELVNFWRVEHRSHGYQEIASPLVNKADLWKTSGHWDHYKDDMFIADMGENEVYGIKPMNCPNAMIVFQSMQVSYKDLPLRLSDTDRLHRYERSGTLNGLLRCRSFQQDDSHNYISEDMIASEYEHIFEVCKKFYGIFDLSYRFRLGTRPSQFLGDIETWDKAEKALRDILEKSGVDYTVAEGDGAFYGPKVDILMKDSLNRDWQMGTIQLDFQQPRRFELYYTDKDGSRKTPVVVHRVIYGSLERFIGILVEHTAGAFPLWLSPVQAKIIPIGDAHHEEASKVHDFLNKAGIRSELNLDTPFGKQVRQAKTEKIPYFVIIGDKDLAVGCVTLESRDHGQIGQITKDELIARLSKEITEKK